MKTDRAPRTVLALGEKTMNCIQYLPLRTGRMYNQLYHAFLGVLSSGYTLFYMFWVVFDKHMYPLLLCHFSGS